MVTNRMRPVHPGEILRHDVLEELGLSASALAKALHVPANRITAIVNERRAITAETALRLARYLGTTAQFWINLQATYDLRTAELAIGAKVETEVRPLERAA
jgi:addiction module HigA family antidote